MSAVQEVVVPEPDTGVSKLPWLSVVNRVQRRGTVPTSEQLNEWVEAVAATNSRQAFAALFKHFAPRVKAYMMLCGSSETSAEELAQETMVSLWRKAKLFDPNRAALSTWIFAIARNLRVDSLRRDNVPLVPDEEDLATQLVDPGPAVEDCVWTGENAVRIRLAMSQLSPEQKHLLSLSFFKDHPHPEIAQELGLPLGTVKSRIRRALARLRELLEGMQQ